MRQTGRLIAFVMLLGFLGGSLDLCGAWSQVSADSTSTRLTESGQVAKDPAEADSLWVKTFVEEHSDEYAIYMSGGEPCVYAYITMDGQTSLPVSANVKVFTRIADTVHAEVPVRCIPVLQSLPAVKSIRFLTIVERLRMFIRDNIHQFAIDTTGDEPMIDVGIEVVDGNFSELDSAGINTFTRIGNKVATEIPIRLMGEIGSLPSVKSVEPLGYVHCQSAAHGQSGNGSIAGHILRYSRPAPSRLRISLLRHRMGASGDMTEQFQAPIHMQSVTDSAGNFILKDVTPGIYDCTFEFPDERFEAASEADAYDEALSLCDKVIVERVEIEAGVCSIVLIDPHHSKVRGQPALCRAVWQPLFQPINQ